MKCRCGDTITKCPRCGQRHCPVRGPDIEPEDDDDEDEEA